MRLEGCVRKDIMMDLEEPHACCKFISIGILPLEMMSANAHNMMMSANAHRWGCSWGAWHCGVTLTSKHHYRLAWPEGPGGVWAP